MIKISTQIQEICFLGVLIFSPFARGSSPRWAFLIALWLAVVSISFMMFRRVLNGNAILPRTDLDYAIWIVIIISVISLIYSINKQATFWALLRLALYVIIFYIVVDIAQSKAKIKIIISLLRVIVLILIVIGFLKLLKGPVPQFWIYDSRDIYFTSTFRNHNHIAGYLGMVVSLTLALFLHKPKSDIILNLFVITFGILALIFTLSRGAWVSFIFSLCTIFFFKYYGHPSFMKKASKFFLLTAIFLIVVLVGSNSVIDRIQTYKEIKTDQSLQARLIVWKTTTKMIKQRPIIGSGLGTFSWAYAKYRPPGIRGRFMEAHNDYLQIVSELGLLVIIPLLYGLVVTFKTSYVNYFRSKSRLTSGIICGSLAGIVGILVHSVSDFNIQITANGILFSTLFGLIFASPSLIGTKKYFKS